MSRVILAKPTSAPSGVRIGSITTCAQKRLPSLRTRQPSLLIAAFARRGFQRALRAAPRGAIFLGIEAREMLADDLVRRIALDALRPRIPVGDDAFGVEHIDRIVGDALDQQPELFLAAAKRLFGFAPLGEIAGDLGEAGEARRLAIADGIDHHMGPEAAAILADPPAFAFELAFAGRESPARAAADPGAVFLGIEAGEMLADDFFGGIALEALGARDSSWSPRRRDRACRWRNR